jgi:hypothetical protein
MHGTVRGHGHARRLHQRASIEARRRVFGRSDTFTHRHSAGDADRSDIDFNRASIADCDGDWVGAGDARYDIGWQR